MIKAAFQKIHRLGIAKSFLIIVDYLADKIIFFIRRIFYRWSGDCYGIKEAVFWSNDIEVFLRYSLILRELRSYQHPTDEVQSILEVGAGGEGVARFLKYSGDYKKYEICLADNNPLSLAKVRLGQTELIKGVNLPFGDNKFDTVISVDTLEHIDKDDRGIFMDELKRVTRKTLLLHFVMHDPDHDFLGRDADIKFNDWYLNFFKKEHSWTAEHLRVVPPCYSEIEELLPGASITGTQNVETWLKYTKLRKIPLLGLFTGLTYMIKWKAKDDSPPFHGCFVKWVKRL